MTVSTTANRIQYTGNGVTSAFAVPFIFYAPGDLVVIRTQISTGVDTTLTISTDYTVSGGNGSTGTVTCVSIPTSDQRLTVSRSIPYTQLTDYKENEPVYADVIETNLDRSVILAQQLLDAGKRTLQLSPTTTITTAITVSNPEANKVLVWNSTADGVVNGPTATDINNAAANAASAASSAATATTQAGIATTQAGIATAAAASVSLPTLGAADTVLQVNAGGTALEYGKVAAANINFSAGTAATPVDADLFIFSDNSDSGASKTVSGANLKAYLGGGGGLIDVQVFTSSGTWTKPSGCNSVEVWVIGGGGGGEGSNVDEADGGTSSFGTHCSATGGGKARSGGTQYLAGLGGVGSGGTINYNGFPGENGTSISGINKGIGGGSLFGAGGRPVLSGAGGNGLGYGGGGAGGNDASASGSGGGGGGVSYKRITSGLGTTETVTVGAGGSGGTGARVGGNGASGIVLVKSYL